MLKKHIGTLFTGDLPDFEQLVEAKRAATAQALLKTIDTLWGDWRVVSPIRTAYEKAESVAKIQAIPHDVIENVEQYLRLKGYKFETSLVLNRRWNHNTYTITVRLPE